MLQKERWFASYVNEESAHQIYKGSRLIQGKTRNRSFVVRMTDEELESLDNYAKNSGFSRESYIRMIARKYVPTPLPGDEMVKILHELRKIGTNINQIAYKANAVNVIEEDRFFSSYAALQKSIDQIMKLLSDPKSFEEMEEPSDGSDKSMGSEG